MGHFLRFLKLNLQYLSASVIILSTNHHIRAFSTLTAHLEDIDPVEWTVFPRTTLQDLCQDTIFKNS